MSLSSASPALGSVTERKPLKKLKLLSLIGVTYCMVSGGPYGLEDIVRDSGYSNAILMLLITPILWSFPVALMVSELSSALPQDGGYYVWVKRAMGPFWGFQESWLSFGSSIFDMALYPTLFITYLSRFWPGAQDGHNAALLGIGLIAVCVAMNLLQIRIVGAGSLLMTLVILLPFVVLMIFALKPHPVTAAQAPGPKLEFWGGLVLAMWNYMGWDNTSTVAGEVHRPQRTYPLAMFFSVILVAATYILPIAMASRSGVPADKWETGAWVKVGEAIGSSFANERVGQALGVAIMVGGMVAAFATFSSLILSYSRVPIAMVEDGFLPKFMGLKTRRTGSPWVSVLICAVFWAICLRFSFANLVVADTILYGLSLLLEFAALVILRVKEPNLERPYKVPGGIFGCVLISLGPLPVIAIASYQGLTGDSDVRYIMKICGFLIVLGLVLYFVAAAFRRTPVQPEPSQTGIQSV